MKTRTSLLRAAIGSISRGTLRTQDLLAAFTSELEWQVARNGAHYSLPDNFGQRDRFAALIVEAQDCLTEDDDIADGKEAITEELVNESLPDALQQFCGPYCYFGSREGDGSDFGFWPSIYDIQDLPTVPDSDAARDLGEDYKFVNGPGRVTVYAGDGSVILELA